MSTLSPEARRRIIFSVTSTLYFNMPREYKERFIRRFQRVDGTDFEKFLIEHLQELSIDNPTRTQVMEILAAIFNDLPSDHQAKILNRANGKGRLNYCLKYPMCLINIPEGPSES